jgi:sulfite oxidase
MHEDRSADLDGKHPDLIVRQAAPPNAGPPLSLLAHAHTTPTDLFFVRSHADTPTYDPHTYRLSIGGLVRRPLSLSLAELHENFPRSHIRATLQCAGNRRTELLAYGDIPGELAWGADAIGTAVWGGVSLRAVLDAAQPLEGAQHAAFLSFDQATKEGRTFPFGGSVPLAKALAGEVLLADEMNGAPLLPIHGAPLRVIVPGYIGARSVKWLAAVALQAGPSENYFQTQAYRLFPADLKDAPADAARGMMLGELSLTSVICTPGADARLPAGCVRVAGYAMAGGGRTVERVELSADGGASWRQAELGQAEPWAWRLWHATLELAPGPAQLAVRAWDSAANVQPEDYRTVWNCKGYMNNAWHRIDVIVEAQR